MLLKCWNQYIMMVYYHICHARLPWVFIWQRNPSWIQRFIGIRKITFTFLRLGNPPIGNAEVLKSWEPAIADDDDDDDDDDGEDEDGFISNFSPFPANVLRFVVDHELHPMQLMRLGRFPWRWVFQLSHPGKNGKRRSEIGCCVSL